MILGVKFQDDKVKKILKPQKHFENATEYQKHLSIQPHQIFRQKHSVSKIPITARNGFKFATILLDPLCRSENKEASIYFGMKIYGDIEVFLLNDANIAVDLCLNDVQASMENSPITQGVRQGKIRIVVPKIPWHNKYVCLMSIADNMAPSLKKILKRASDPTDKPLAREITRKLYSGLPKLKYPLSCGAYYFKENGSVHYTDLENSGSELKFKQLDSDILIVFLETNSMTTSDLLACFSFYNYDVVVDSKLEIPKSTTDNTKNHEITNAPEKTITPVNTNVVISKPKKFSLEELINIIKHSSCWGVSMKEVKSFASILLADNVEDFKGLETYFKKDNYEEYLTFTLRYCKIVDALNIQKWIESVTTQVTCSPEKLNSHYELVVGNYLTDLYGNLEEFCIPTILKKSKNNFINYLKTILGNYKVKGAEALVEGNFWMIFPFMVNAYRACMIEKSNSKLIELNLKYNQYLINIFAKE